MTGYEIDISTEWQGAQHIPEARKNAVLKPFGNLFQMPIHPNRNTIARMAFNANQWYKTHARNPISGSPHVSIGALRVQIWKNGDLVAEINAVTGVVEIYGLH